MKYLATPNHHGLGWVPDLPDSRDLVFTAAAVTRETAETPAQVDLRPGCPPVYNQGQLGSCTANALAAAFDFDRHLQRHPFMTPSRLFIYWNERELEGTTATDSGARIRDGIKVLKNIGAAPEHDWPYLITKFATKPPAKAFADAHINETLLYQRITAPMADPTVNMLACLASGRPFITGITIYESFETPATARTGVIPLPKATEAVLGGHAVLVVGYERPKNRFICRNSWGKNWGDAGYCYLPFEYLTNPALASDQWVIKTVEA